MVFCPLASGSGGNAAYVGFGGRHYLVDAGISARRTMKALGRIGVDCLHGIFVTHEHSDHIAGIEALSRRFGLDVYASPKTCRYLLSLEKFKNVKKEQMKPIATGEPLHIGDTEIVAFRVAHDACEPVGYSFVSGGAKLAVATDLGWGGTDCAAEAMRGAKVIMLESNHDLEMLQRGRYPPHLKARVAGERGHLSNHAAGLLLAEAVVPGHTIVCLAHLSEENNTPMLACDTVMRILEARGAVPARLYAADRDYPGERVEL